MKHHHRVSPLLLVLLTTTLLLLPSAAAADNSVSSTAWAGIVGVNYPVTTPGLPTPNDVAKAIAKAGIPRVNLINPDAASISAFSGTGIEVGLSLADPALLQSLSKDNASALNWVNKNVVPSQDSVKVTSISVGLGVLTSQTQKNLSALLLPTLQGMYNACQSLGLTNITVTTTHSFFIISKPFPPSSAEVAVEAVPHLKELLQFADSTNGAFQIELYPYEIFRSGGVKDVTEGFATFNAKDNERLQDPMTKVMYENLYEAMVDATVAILSGFGYDMMPIVVAGTGWPAAAGDATGTSVARDYNQGLINHINKLPGTPLRMTATPVTYIKALFDDPPYEGAPPYNGTFAIWEKNMTERYPLKFTMASGGGGAAAGGVVACLLPLVAFLLTSL